jgi:hypothetical protein
MQSIFSNRLELLLVMVSRVGMVMAVISATSPAMHTLHPLLCQHMIVILCGSGCSLGYQSRARTEGGTARHTRQGGRKR